MADLLYEDSARERGLLRVVSLQLWLYCQLLAPLNYLEQYLSTHLNTVLLIANCVGCGRRVVAMIQSVGCSSKQQ